ncbi:MAG: hypothetical protein JXB15_04720 [Anaerolineales bacterium]|nr:hypothetical protein [Anaerolineales bacterium]
MNDNFGTVPVQDYGSPIPPLDETPKKKDNTVLIVVIVVLVVLCCCCVIVGGGLGYWLWENGDELFDLTHNLRGAFPV